MSRQSGRQESRVKIRLFGSFGIWIDGKRVFGLHRREGEKLLAYLVLHAGEPITYRTLATLFWPSEAFAGMDGGSTFQSTRQAVRSLRVALGAEARRLVSVGKGIIWLDLAGTDVDVLRFDYCAQNSQEASLRAEALELHSEQLLVEWQENWVVEARQRRLRSYNRLLALQDPDGEQMPLPPLPMQRIPDPPFAHDAPEQTTVNTASGRGGGAVDPSSQVYTPRRCDVQFANAIQSGDGTILLKGGIQSGKSSLLARGLQHARAIGARVSMLDFKMLSDSELANTESFYMALAANTALQLDVEFNPEKHWIQHLGPGMNLEQFLRRHILTAGESRLVWARTSHLHPHLRPPRRQ